ncbi:class I SAM-dependent methyltransferase [Teredinibacter purpureus]|uniref:class I SAM-dependent methyltransferase n=1 Tax=Teredinibacter purpureus TaxID=2731756 RepID=UPI0005F7EB57|nr:class I SAM-dependent methyltransferase [Teredinibacter purpureus]
MTDTGPSKCRFCNDNLEHSFADLGLSPLCQTHIKPEELNNAEYYYPLHAYVCTSCWLVQLEEFVSPDDIFSDYDYFSSYSTSWVEHARKYVEYVSDRFSLGKDSAVFEIASNDGYLLQHFVKAGVPVLGIEPAENIAKVANEKGIRTTVCFHGQASATKNVEAYGKADLVLGNNVLAHVPDINDFISGLKTLLKDDGVITMEFPHLLQLIDQNQFDTIYHEHFSYLSFLTVEKMFKHHGLTLFDVQEIPTHGGSLRIFGRHTESEAHAVTDNVTQLRDKELGFGLGSLDVYLAFQEKVKKTKRDLLKFLIEKKEEGKSIVAYGAPGKGNTLLNYCAIREDFVDFTVDMSPQKQGKYTPGCRLPILHPDAIKEHKPDYILILPWNLTKEIVGQNEDVFEWGGKFVRPIPEVCIIDKPQ